MPASSALPLAARQAAWHALWQRLLRPLPGESESDQTERADEPTDDPDDETDAAHQALAEMPTAEALVPEASVEERRALAERDRQKRQADHETSVAGTMALLAGYRQS
jgi:hypothetical protein